ncbi:MAG: endonuclease III [bacterium]|nr:endonuclease III [bacterium]MDZ4284791.1 endonuclease III [Patescibacteria group bacterium]
MHARRKKQATSGTNAATAVFAERKRRARAIARALKELLPNARIALNYSNHWELAVAVVLSAQCTDKKVNEVTARLFKKYRTLEDYIRGDPREFEQDIRETGFFRAKAKNILAAARILKERFGGMVPCSMEELLLLPGVARKTANVILGNACGIVVGVAVDTHVKRFAQKFNLSDSRDPQRIERDLMELLPQCEWFTITYRLIDYGRHFCPARKHECGEHPLTKLYPRAAGIWPRAR